MYYSTDTIGNAIVPVSDEDGDDIDNDDFSLDAVATTVLENKPFTRAFDTDTFYRFDVVVARPIQQQYVHDGELHTFKKPAAELRQSAWSLDNKPYPLTHPDTKIVRSPDQVHGFHRNPRYEKDYDEDGDALVTSLYVPTTDDEAIQFIRDNPSVSVGVHNDLQWEVDEQNIDAYQTNLYFDHAAGVERGRCSLEDGCGIVTDTSIEPLETVSADADDISVGSTVKWSTDNEEWTHGQIESIDDDTATIAVLDYDTETFSDETIELDTSTVQTWVGPNVDSCPGETCSCGCHGSVTQSDSTTDSDDDTPDTSNTNSTMSDSDDNPDFDMDSYLNDMAVDAIAEKHDGVAELIEDKDSATDRVDVLEDKVDTLEQSLDEAEDKLEAFENGEREPKSAVVDSITDLTGAWEEDELMDMDRDELERRKQVAEDAATEPSTPDGGGEPTTDSESGGDGGGSSVVTSVADTGYEPSWK